MIFDLKDLIYFENDMISEDEILPMTDFNKRHKPHTLITGDFDIIPAGSPESLVLFASYTANT